MLALVILFFNNATEESVQLYLLQEEVLTVPMSYSMSFLIKSKRGNIIQQTWTKKVSTIILSTMMCNHLTGVLRSIECFRYILEYSGKYVFSCEFLEKSLKAKKKKPLKRDYELINTRPKFAKIQYRFYFYKRGELLVELKGGNFMPKSGKR